MHTPIEKTIVSIESGKDDKPIYSGALKKLMREPQTIFIKKKNKLCPRVNTEKIILNPEIKIFENKERRSELFLALPFHNDRYGIELSIV